LEYWKLNCPKCGKSSIAEIIWGYVTDVESIRNELDKGEMILGGCLVTDNDPKWECTDCFNRWGKRDDD
jgi:hypothetical protein